MDNLKSVLDTHNNFKDHDIIYYYDQINIDILISYQVFHDIFQKDIFITNDSSIFKNNNKKKNLIIINKHINHNNNEINNNINNNITIIYVNINTPADTVGNNIFNIDINDVYYSSTFVKYMSDIHADEEFRNDYNIYKT